MKCPNCGARVPSPQPRSCAYCGVKLLGPEEDAERSAPPAPDFHGLERHPSYGELLARDAGAGERKSFVVPAIFLVAFIATGVTLAARQPEAPTPPLLFAALGVVALFGLARRHAKRRRRPPQKRPAYVVSLENLSAAGEEPRLVAVLQFASESD